MHQAPVSAAPRTPCTVLIVEDDVAARARFVSAIGASGDEFECVTFDTAVAALRWLEENEPQVLLCDLGLPDRPGLSVISYCARRWPRCDSMVITLYEDAEHVFKSLEAGATGYLLKDSARDEIVDHVRELRSGGAPMTPLIARLVLRHFRKDLPSTSSESAAAAVTEGQRPGLRQIATGDAEVELSERERTVLTRIAQGFSYAEIADLERLSRHTVHSHIKRIYSKLSVHSRSEAVFEASNLGLIKLR